MSEAVLIGVRRLHLPSVAVERPSAEPGHGEFMASLCGRYKGIAYDHSVASFHAPELTMCAWCSRESRRSLASSLTGSPGVVQKGERT